jgi:hypothetical protein
MRSFVIAALVGTIAAGSPTDPEIVRIGDAPTCKIVNGHTVVNYSPSFHASFKCTHSADACTCTTAHPTSAKGGCKEIDGTNGITVQHAGDCVTKDAKWTYMFQGSCDRSGPWGTGKIMQMYGASDGSHARPGGTRNPGTTHAERVEACGNACLNKRIVKQYFSWAQQTWDGYKALGFGVAQTAEAGGAGNCWCLSAPSDPCRAMVQQNGKWVNTSEGPRRWGNPGGTPGALAWLKGNAAYYFN